MTSTNDMNELTIEGLRDKWMLLFMVLLGRTSGFNERIEFTADEVAEIEMRIMQGDAHLYVHGHETFIEFELCDKRNLERLRRLAEAIAEGHA